MKGGKDMGMNNTALNPMDTDTRVTRIIADTEVKTPRVGNFKDFRWARVYCRGFSFKDM